MITDFQEKILKIIGIILILALVLPISVLGADFSLHSNGVTVLCGPASVGDTGIVNEINYTKRSKSQITVLNAGTSCTSNITNMVFMFGMQINNPNVVTWDVSAVESMEYMFIENYDFNQSIDEWDVSAVENMNGMFYNAEDFNQNLSGWCVSNFSSEPSNFGVGSGLSSANKPVWGTCPGDNTCTYSGSGDWNINISDNCIINDETEITGIIRVSGDNGFFLINSSISMYGFYFEPSDFDGDSIFQVSLNGQLNYIKQGGS